MTGLILNDDDGDLALLRDSVAGFAQRHDGPATLRARRASGEDLDRASWAAMAEAGWLGVMVPEELGGAGLGHAEQSILCEALGQALITEPLAQLSVLSGALIAAAEPGAERQRLAEGLMSGAAIVAPAWQGADGSTGPIVARSTPNGITLSGRISYVSAAQSATDFLVLAEENGQALLLSVPANSNGLKVAAHATLDGSQLATLTLEQVTVPTQAVLSRADAADAALEQAIAAARLAISAELVGIGTRAIEDTIAYTKERVQFGRPIAGFQVVQHRLVDMWADAEFAAASVSHAVEMQNEGESLERDLAVLAAKARAGDAAVTITRRALHLYGAMGFTDDCDIGLYMKRAVALNATLGQPETLRLQFVARERAAA